MGYQWEAEQTIEQNVALQLIQEQFPELRAEQIRFLGAGWDNSAFVINEQSIFRFPRRKIALELLEAEWLMLGKLAAYLPLPIPIPEFRGEPRDLFPWPFIGYKMLPGKTACHANLKEEERAAFAQPLGEFLQALHHVPRAQIPVFPTMRDNIDRIRGETILFKLKKNFDELEQLQLLENRKWLEVVIEKLSFRPPAATAIVHGDFYVRHLLVDDTHKLVGVIDFGDIHVGDPAIDLSIAHGFLPKSAHDAFRKAYGDMSEETWQLAKLRSILSSTYIVLYGHQSEDIHIKNEGLRALQLY